MNTSTPAVFNQVRGNGAVEKQLNFQRILLFVGELPGNMPEAAHSFVPLVVQDVQGAIQLIAELLNLKHKAPSVIVYHFCDQHINELAAWGNYFSTHSALRSIPFFVCMDHVDEAKKAIVKQHLFVDDIILPASFATLESKADFVSNFKKMRATLQPQVDTRLSGFRLEKLKPTRKGWNHFMKRTFDIVAASSALVLLAPVLLVIAVMIKLDSKGPVFYSSPRAGRNYRIFKFYKFRTMVQNADKKLDQLKHMNQYGAESGPVFYKVSNDPRVTRLGKFLRNSSLDELPQLANVLLGHMSLVGNRPLPLYEAAGLTTDEAAQRFLAPAGITGLWQISKRGRQEMSATERIHLDIDYTRRHCFTYDMWLMVNTPFALMQKDNV